MLAPLFWIWMVTAVVIGIGAWIAGRQIRRELAGMPDNAIADANAAYIKPTPWEKLSRVFLLRPTKGGNYRLRMETETKWLTRYPIDAEIQCTPEQATELDKYIRGKMESVRPRDPRLLEAIEQWKRYQEEEKPQ